MSAVAKLLDAVRKLHQGTPALASYAPWPDDLSAQQILPVDCPAADLVTTQSLRGTRQTGPVIKALRQASHHLHWKQTYREDEVGQTFLQNYGYVELFGPGGHFRSYKLRGFLGYWGPGLTYDWHAHEAEELYFTLAGQAVFCAKDAANALMKPGLARDHQSHQPHLMVTLDHPYLAYVIWRGPGMDGVPAMVAS